VNRNLIILIAILLAFFILAIGYGLANPLFEAPDENLHYFTAQYIADTGALPSVGDDSDSLMGQEAAQPPLYYVLASLFVRSVGADHAEELVWPNPRVRLGYSDALSNTNTFVHTPDEEWPWQDWALAAHLMRFFSALMGVGTLLFIYGSARLVWPDRHYLALLAVSIVAFLPQFGFLHGSISNDPLVIVLCSAAIWQLLRMWYGEASWAALIILGVTIGLAILTKMAGLLLLIYSLFFLTVMIIRQRRGLDRTKILGYWLAAVTIVASVALVISGWLLLRNWQLYEDITATSAFIQIAGGDRNFSLAQVLREMPGLLNSSIGVFGWMNILPANWVYIFWKSLFAVGLVGGIYEVVKSFRKQRTEPGRSSLFRLDAPWIPAVLLSVWALVVYAGLTRFLLQTPAAQGRLLFPAILPLALGLTYGLSLFRSRWLYLLIAILALATSLQVLLVAIPNAYSLPSKLAEEQLPFDANRLEVDLGQGLEIVAVRLETSEAVAGDIVWLTLYWQIDDTAPQAWNRQSPQMVIEMLGRDEELVGKTQGYHGKGLYPAALWTPGEILEDRIRIRIADDLDAPTQIRLTLKLAGETSSVDLGGIKVSPSSWPDFSEEIAADLGGIQISEAALGTKNVSGGDVVPVHVRWQVEIAPEQNLTTLVHLGDPAQLPLAQGDSPPLNGDYPTGLWDVDEVIDDYYSVVVPSDLAAGRYPVYIGMYDPISGIRRPLFIDGERQPNDVLLVDWLMVEND
jgi:hypothetical protein